MTHDSDSTPNTNVQAEVGIGWPPPDAGAKYYLLKTSPLTATLFAEYLTKEDLVRAATVAFDEAVTVGDKFAKLFVFVGTHVPVRGEAVRRLEFPDGSTAAISPDVEAVPDEDFILPPSARKA